MNFHARLRRIRNKELPVGSAFAKATLRGQPHKQSFVAICSFSLVELETHSFSVSRTNRSMTKGRNCEAKTMLRSSTEEQNTPRVLSDSSRILNFPARLGRNFHCFKWLHYYGGTYVLQVY